MRAVTRKSVRRALIGWPRCPECGHWCEPSDGSWECTQIHHVVRWNGLISRWLRRPNSRMLSAWTEVDGPEPKLSPNDPLVVSEAE